MCDWRVEHGNIYHRGIFLQYFLANSEANASELARKSWRNVSSVLHAQWYIVCSPSFYGVDCWGGGCLNMYFVKTNDSIGI